MPSRTALITLLLLLSVRAGVAGDTAVISPAPCPPYAAAVHRIHDEVWCINTRTGCPEGASPFRPLITRYDDAQGWTSSDLETLLSAPAQLTIIYVHGNRMTHSNAVQRGLAVYRSLVTSNAPPVRLVIWSWPSDPLRRPLRDVRIKAYRAEAESVNLARFLNRLPGEHPVSLVGYSYGSRVIGGALHVLGGGTVNGLGLNEQVRRTPPMMRATFMAPAIDRDAFARGRVFQYAMGVVQRPQVLFNPRDPVLKRYRLVNRRRGSQAMGFAGSWGGVAVEQYNVRGYIGRSHDERLYLNSGAILGSIRPYLLWQN